MIVWWNGRLLSEDEVKISPFDPGLLRGEGVFETILGVDGKIVSWPRHLKRLRVSADLLGVSVPQESALVEAIRMVLEENDLAQGKARIRITLGDNELVTAVPLPERAESARVVVVDLCRNEKSPLCHAKTCSYAENMLALSMAKSKGADEAILANTKGELCEGSMSNLFFVKDGKIHTPALDCGCLPGTVREALLEIAEIEVGHWPIAILDEADEIWLTSSTRPITWVSHFGERALGGPSQLIQESKEALIRHIGVF
ncbi:aminotransferase class IV [Akkermansiaceae bacterium]|nr:aminotransferase class IV [Akkermansiaceae bacterium]MDA7888459.1 aminotransferase class IV [Akkermansiaceae bacterium]MDB4537623.1 aminotransferase class IV [Akkermansiaceae bacterium]MDB4544754.1 aminotransferase class IV [Akkermansiaceae bacterium]